MAAYYPIDKRGELSMPSAQKPLLGKGSRFDDHLDQDGAEAGRGFKNPKNTPVDEPVAPRKATKKPGNARFSTEPETLGGTDSQGQTSDDIGTKTGNSYIYRTKDGKTRGMGKSALPDDKAKDYASELQRETRGMKKGGSVGSASRRADGIAVKGKTKGRMI